MTLKTPAGNALDSSWATLAHRALVEAVLLVEHLGFPRLLLTPVYLEQVALVDQLQHVGVASRLLIHLLVIARLGVDIVVGQRLVNVKFLRLYISIMSHLAVV